MKLRISYPDVKNGPIVEIDDTPENCAALLRGLGQGRVTKVTKEAARDAQAKGGVILTSEMPKHNRRALVLEAMRNLRSSGVLTPNLKQIKARFEVLFPDASLHNLDQVVRDLANKTDLLLRAGRGKFELPK